MKYYSASKIHNGLRFETNRKIIAFDEQNSFTGFFNPDEIDAQDVQYFEGILMPAFVNAHCHLELSHTKGNIPEGTGLVPFLGLVVSSRNADENVKSEHLSQAVNALIESGCIAVGDIANSSDTLLTRQNVPMHFQTFVETMGFIPESAQQRFDFSEQVYQQFVANNKNKYGYELRQSIVPHAPYSVSDKLFTLINNYKTDSLLSIHNEECIAENEYFKTKTGQMFTLYERLKIDDTWFKPTGKNSLPSYLPLIDNSHNLILVHNTFMEQSDIDVIKEKNINASICLCPNANIYIEEQLPDINLLTNSGLNICLGTDSLASNHQLNIYSEIKTLQAHFPNISEEQLLSWASFGGAKALHLDHIIGSLEPTKKPGLVNINNGVSKRIL